MIKLAVILTQGFADWECALLMATGQEYFGFELVTATPDGEPVISSGGLRVTPDTAVGALKPEGIDAIAVCGGTIWQSEAAPDLGPVLAQFSGAGVLIGGICDGVLALARAGLLEDRAHTGNDLETLKTVPGYGGAALYRDVPGAVRSDKLVTAAGTAPVTFMAEMVRGLGYGSEQLDFYLGLLAAEHGSQSRAAAGGSIS